jgi:hypothetical protein
MRYYLLALCMVAVSPVAASTVADIPVVESPVAEVNVISDVTTAQTSVLPSNALPAGTFVELEFVDAVDSKVNKVGDKIAMKVAEPVMLNDKIAIPAGLPVAVEVVHAAKARVAGKPGELILIARYIDMDGRQIPLKGFKFGNSGTGKSLVDESTAVAFIVASPLALLIVGGEKHAAAGVRAHAKLKEIFQLEAIGGDVPETVPEPITREANQ